MARSGSLPDGWQFVNLEEVKVYEAIREGVHDAFYQMITNATDMPCRDFYDTVREAVKEAMLELGPMEASRDG